MVPARIIIVHGLVGKDVVDTLKWAVTFGALIVVGEGLSVHETAGADEDEHATSVVAGLVDPAYIAVDGLEWHWGKFW